MARPTPQIEPPVEQEPPAARVEAEDEQEPAAVGGGAEAKLFVPDKSYGKRRGYSTGFLGLPVPLPNLSAAQRKVAARNLSAKPGDDPFEVKYQHFSVVVNGVRRLAFFTAVNIDGASVVKFDRKTGAVTRGRRTPARRRRKPTRLGTTMTASTTGASATRAFTMTASCGASSAGIWSSARIPRGAPRSGVPRAVGHLPLHQLRAATQRVQRQPHRLARPRVLDRAGERRRELPG